MRVVFFHPAFEAPGGAEVLCVREAALLRAGGADVGLVTLAYDPEVWAERLDGIPVQLARKRHWTDAFVFYSRRGKLRVRGWRACRHMRNCDVAVAHNYPCNAMLGASMISGRKVWQCNEPVRRLHVREANPRLTERVEALTPGAQVEDFSSRSWPLVLDDYDRAIEHGRSRAEEIRFDRDMTQRLDHIYAISEYSRDNARRIYGRCAEEVVHPLVRFPEGRWNRSRPAAERLQVLAHSRLETHKNIDVVLRGFALFARERPGAHLHIVGEGPLREPLQQLAAELMPADRFTFYGYLAQAELDAVYARSDALALLTLDEPFGMVFPEAAARGLLLIGPDHGGPFEILQGGELGWCVDPFSPPALAEALEQVGALSAGEAERRRSEADRICRERFAVETILPKLQHAVFEGSS